ncbi:MAG: hypothetical protein DI533_15040 [Cereibacter sphaeroides]|uniref:Uncharacterized protein n=1 Tax=Cereibacter sphaeroides TaxID=1063 RepID=A0A2W5S1Q1_CERSP|nr:MAG: hypothetical protein DI533_15040 [Cereibacter sphaeroides]
MCGLRKIFAASVLTLAMQFQAFPLSAQTPDARTFAFCAGRLSALMEHQWLFSDPLADQTMAQRDAMLALTEAIAAPADQAKLVLWRVEAKTAQAELLNIASFGTNKTTAARAAQRSEELVSACSALLLG